MVSIPGEVSLGVEETFSGVLGTNWLVVRDSGLPTEFFFERISVNSVGSERFKFAPGRGFWAISDTTWVVEPAEVNAVDLMPGGVAEIDIQQGWNIIGNIYDRSLSWDTVVKANPFLSEETILHGFDGAFLEATELIPYQAYYLFNPEVNQSLILPFPGFLESTPTEESEAGFKQHAQTSFSSEKHKLSIYLTTGDSLKNAAHLVIHPDAKKEIDRHDQYAPRSLATSLSFTFTPGFEMPYGSFALEARPVFQDGDSFNATLIAAPGNPIEINVEGLEAFHEWDVVLIEMGTGQVFNLHTTPSFTLNPQWKESAYRIVIGSGDFVNAQQNSAPPGRLST